MFLWLLGSQKWDGIQIWWVALPKRKSMINLLNPRHIQMKVFLKSCIVFRSLQLKFWELFSLISVIIIIIIRRAGFWLKQQQKIFLTFKIFTSNISFLKLTLRKARFRSYERTCHSQTIKLTAKSKSWHSNSMMSLLTFLKKIFSL